MSGKIKELSKEVEVLEENYALSKKDLFTCKRALDDMKVLLEEQLNLKLIEDFNLPYADYYTTLKRKSKNFCIEVYNNYDDYLEHDGKVCSKEVQVSALLVSGLISVSKFKVDFQVVLVPLPDNYEEEVADHKIISVYYNTDKYLDYIDSLIGNNYRDFY